MSPPPLFGDSRLRRLSVLAMPPPVPLRREGLRLLDTRQNAGLALGGSADRKASAPPQCCMDGLRHGNSESPPHCGGDSGIP